jgi:hypothetical protein
LRGECQFALFATGDSPAALMDQVVMEGPVHLFK